MGSTVELPAGFVSDEDDETKDLPPGFIADEPEQPTLGLPPGFVPDEQDTPQIELSESHLTSAIDRARKLSEPQLPPAAEPQKGFFESAVDDIIKAGEITSRVPYAAYGVAEVATEVVLDLMGALTGVVSSAFDTVTKGAPTPENDADRIRRGVPGDSPMSRKFMDLLPDAVNNKREAFAIYRPVTEEGKALEHLFGQAFEWLAEQGGDFGDYVFEKTESPVLGAAARIVPEGLAMLAPFFITGGKGTMSQVAKDVAPLKAALEEQALEVAKTGEGAEIFSDSLLREYPALTTEDKIKLVDIDKRIKEAESGEYLEFGSSKVQDLIDNWKAERQEILDRGKITGNDFTLTRMTPYQILALTDKTIKQDTGKQHGPLDEVDTFIANLREKHQADEAANRKRAIENGIFPIPERKIPRDTIISVLKGEDKIAEPVVLARDGDRLVVIEGAEIASIAAVLGKKDIPVKIMEDNIPNPIIQSYAEKVRRMEEASRQTQRDKEAKAAKPMVSRIAEATWDRNYDMKKKIIGEFGDSGKKVVTEFDMIAGAPASAKITAEAWLTEIYAPLSRSQEEMLDSMVKSRRAIQIDRYKGPGQVKHQGGLSATEHKANLEQYRKDLGDAEFTKMMKLTDRYFEAHRETLAFALKERLISEKDYAQMVRFDYEPKQYLNRIDPVREHVLGGKKINVHESGYYELKGGSAGPEAMSSRELLLETIMRTHTRVFRNRANRKLIDIAREFPENPLIKIAKPEQKQPKGMDKIEAIIDNEKVTVFMDPMVSRQWVHDSPDMTHYAVEAMRIMAGTPLVKQAAVGMNPAFFLTDFPRNIAHAYLASTRSFAGDRMYSPHLPVFLGQIAKDIAEVAGDSATKKGITKTLIEEGGAPSFLAHIGQEPFFTKEMTIREQLDPKFARVKKIAAWLNEFGELTMRNAILRRGQKNGLSNHEAAYEARRIIDYSQSGRIGKVADHVIPFLNPAIQATRTAVRGAKESPGDFAWKTAWLSSAAAYIYFQNTMINPEGMKQVPDYIRANYHVIMLPPSMAIRTPPSAEGEGDIIYPYIKIRKDGLVALLTAPVEFAMAKHYENREPTNMALDSIASLSPVGTQSIPPTIKAITESATNKSLWTDQELWSKQPVEPWAEYYAEHEKKHTPRIYVELGRALHEGFGLDRHSISPVKIENTVNNFMANHPLYKWSLAGSDALMGGVPDYEKRRELLDLIGSQPFVRRLIGFTHPSTQFFTRIEEVELQTPTEEKILNDKLDSMIAAVQNKEIDDKTLRAWIRNNNVTQRARLQSRYLAAKSVDVAFRGVKNRTGIPDPRAWVYAASSLKGEDRAEAYYRLWIDSPNERRATLDRLAKRVEGFWSLRFDKRLKELKKTWGAESVED